MTADEPGVAHTAPADVEPHIAPLGDAALTVVFGERVDAALGERVRRAASVVRRAAAAGTIAGVVDIVPAYTTLVVHYDPLAVEYLSVAARLLELVRGLPDASDGVVDTPRHHLLPVRYDGPDLDDVARRCRLDAREVVERHASVEYRVELVGFVPGFGYLAPLDAALVLPRRDRPRHAVPAGSVAIAGAQTGIYPLTTPGGWHIIGRTEIVLFDPARAEPALLRAGDRVRFVPFA